ncbi:M23 family peptidase [Paenibacillus chitinolyticus]|uniref:M23 family metallopeptidase n=1 Tax=Paenibacillus chitinolyticus TaxID=79263 RepID=A0A410X2B1_9BACL|nr:M23 family metallopeptidase [Paenibacillus chitinolyticus]MCY9593585.1 M23 family metallopeptidase [Paenibacillus chitinolyticus]MCY9597556.1 M23 family metallopeptidase [Paenibacillus chitinolyticus]QAV20753.1 M23 family peptidase [Paenibacillus chitinolyticus]
MKRTATIWGMAAVLLVLPGLAGCGRTEAEPSSAVSPAPPAASPDAEKEAKFEPENLAALFLQGKIKEIYSRFSPEFKKDVSLEQLSELAGDFNKDVRAYKLQSKLPLGDGDRYVWTDESGQKGLTAAIDGKGVIQGLQFVPLKTYPASDEAFSRAEFSLPFRGEWTVFWGGTNVLLNYHYEHESQRYAYDLVQIKGTSSYTGDPGKLESYYAYNQEVTAPAPGIVKAVENGRPDNPIGQTDEKNPAGNHVIIDHGSGEYSFLAHFKKGTITVKPGDKIERGQLLGRVGNSGNTSEPHIHFHVADGTDLFGSKSVRIRFEGGAAPKQGDVLKGVR